VERAVNSNWGREFCQLRPTFPDKPLIKAYVALWESCTSIAPLQLLSLEFFKCVDIFGSYTILNDGCWNRNGCQRRRCDVQSARTSEPFHPRGVRDSVRCMDPSVAPRWTMERRGNSADPVDPCSAPRQTDRSCATRHFPPSCHTCFSKENQVQTYMHARINFHAYS
jgi:hypothetical protein